MQRIDDNRQQLLDFVDSLAPEDWDKTGSPRQPADHDHPPRSSI
jgi:hypothetical protein